MRTMAVPSGKFPPIDLRPLVRNAYDDSHNKPFPMRRQVLGGTPYGKD